jgi:hypothetical protein
MTLETQQELCLLKDKAIHILKRNNKENSSKLRVISVDFDKFIVDSHTEFGRGLLSTPPKETPFYEIPGLLSPQNNLIRLFRSILINYHVAFGDYSRIKECQNDDCEHIYFEKKKGESKFCSSACRIAQYRKEDPAKIKCRQRHNKWIGYQFNKSSIHPSVMYKDNCTECKAVIFKGECPVLMDKNAPFFELLQTTPKKTKN